MNTADVKIAVIGTGNRGCKYLLLLRSEGAAVCAVADSDPQRLGRALAIAGADCAAFDSAGQMLAAGVLPTAAIIATPERAHAADALMLLRAGVHLLIEKPVATSLDDCAAIEQEAGARGLIVGVCHVLRYHPYFRKLHSLARGGTLGEVVSITHRLNVGIDRACHTFVRGPWGDTAATSPMLLSKCCHDLDLLVWLAGSGSSSVVSAGGTHFFTPQSAPEGSADRCIDCSCELTCPYSAVDLYRRRGEWTEGFGAGCDAVDRQLAVGPYGRCVFRCGNTTVDRQALVISFASGAVATLTMNMFTAGDARDTHICLTGGEIHGDGTTITVTPLRGPRQVFDFADIAHEPYHAGADRRIIADFIKAVQGRTPAMLASLDSALESHRMAFIAEAAARRQS